MLCPYSRSIAQKSSSNFYYSFFFLPKEKREGIFAVYAFSRLVDDAVDEALDGETAKRQIALWRKRLEICYGEAKVSSETSHPILKELEEVVVRFLIPKKLFDDLLTGVEMDVAKKSYATFQELETYCYHVAGTIGLMCNCLFGKGPEDAPSRQYALLLGTAFQLTNIIRDVGEDAKKGRVYLPADEMARFGVMPEDILAGREKPTFFDLMRYQCGRAEDYFQKAEAVLSEKDRRGLLPAAIMGAYYHKILHRIREENFPVMRRKIGLSKPYKAFLMGKTLLKHSIH